MSKLDQLARELGEDKFLIKGYDLLEKKGVFFTKNQGIKNCLRKPLKFASNFEAFKRNKNNQLYKTAQLRGLQALAGLSISKEPNAMNENDYTKLQKAYNEWEKDYFVLFLGFQANGDYWPACNLFVGEVIFRAYGAKKSMNGDKFYSAKDYWNNLPGFKKIEPENVQAGDIAAMSSGNHVEIVTNTMRGRFIDDGFCSIGAGRSDGTNGKEKCDDWTNILYTPRELDNSNNKYYRI